jgi:hypothetical protein
MDLEINQPGLMRVLRGIGLPLVIAALILTSLHAQGGVVDTIELVHDSDPPEVRVNFTVPLQYINHAPLTASDELVIQLRQVLPARGLFEAGTDQTVSWASTGGIPLLDATYGASTGDRGTLTIRFSHSVNYKVRQGADPRNIYISVLPAAKTSPSERANKQPRGRKERDGARRVAPVFGPETPFVLNLESSIQPLPIPKLTELERPGLYIPYTTRFEIEGAVWYRLRLGFFPTRKAAMEVLQQIKTRFPRAWVTFATTQEIATALDERGDTVQVQKAQPTPKAMVPAAPPASAPTRESEVTISDISLRTPPPIPQPPASTQLPSTLAAPVKTQAADNPMPLPEMSSERLEGLMEEARQAVANGDYARAVQLYTKILQYADNPYQQDALEYLGLARERKGQLAHAKKEYERYLSLYPEGEGADRVRQRLAGLMTARKTPTPKAKAKSMRAAQTWDVFGGISQFYQRATRVTDTDGSDVDASALTNDIDVTARRRGERYDFQARLSGSYAYDFLGGGSGSETSVSTLYLDGADRNRGVSFRLGRQSRDSGGVLGRFDGLLLGYKLTDWMTLNGVAGFPVSNTDNRVETDRRLHGLSIDWGTFADAWDFNTFIIEQKADGILDRRGIGGEVRYFDPSRSLLTFVDYDISYEDLNTFIFLGTWILPTQTTVNASFDYRNSPVLTTTNALQSQTVSSLDELREQFSDSEIRTLAEDRTASVKTLTTGVSHPFTEHFQVSGDVTATTLSDTPASGGIEAVPGTGWEYFYSLQFIGSSLIKPGDISIVGLRYADGDNANTVSGTLNTRYPVNHQWRLNPRFRLDYRNNDDGTTQWIKAPSFRTEYRWRKRYRFEGEAGAEWSSQQLDEGSSDTSSYFLSLGYRYDF